MKHKTAAKLLSRCLVLSLLLLLTASSVSPAQEWSRRRRAELFGIVGPMSGDETEYADLSADVEFDDTVLYGFGYGYNLDDHFNINTELLFGSTDIDGQVIGIPLGGDADIVVWNINADYNVFKGRLTPVISGGIGVVRLDGDLEAPGVPSESFDESNFSYNLGAGLRWDLEQNIHLKAMYRWLWTELEEADDEMQFDGFYFAVGILF
ncbi:MAG: outer membrane protein [Planctomycetota bacterium]